MVSRFEKVENIVGKEDNAGYQHFLLFPLFFQKSILYYPLPVGKGDLVLALSVHLSGIRQD